MNDTRQTYELFVRATPEKVWETLTDPAATRHFFHGTAVESTFRAGEPIRYLLPNGMLAVEGEILEVAPSSRLSHTWGIRYNEAMSRERSSVSWTIERRGPATKITVVHELAEAPLTAKNVGTDGWSHVLCGLKTLIETGEPLVIED